MKSLGLILILLFSFNVFAGKAVTRRSDDDLTLLLAKQRKSQIQEVTYDLFFELFKGKDEFRGEAEINVVLKNSRLPLSIDLLVDKVESISVNGKEIKGYPKRKGSFDIPAKYLRRENKIEVMYTSSYSKDAGGFLRSIDPEDQSEYVYTDFEPYYAHKLFPCFDQPDLKATFTVKVKAPREWKVIANELVNTTQAWGPKTITTFKTTPKLSTYLFFLGAGPFVEWTDKAGDTPLFIWARKTLAKHVDHEELFKTTKKGLKFFNEYFGHPYPFSKYGQVFIPEFAWGGMENPGAVTLNERNIFRGPVPRSKYEDRDNLILHEMAHMWFGDLVTMEWWNDLWLNESFATYLATIAQERAMDSKATWMDFFGTKTWGYWQDQLVTTHPIETEVPDVRTAKGNFDGITYAKGASALKQLHFYVGEEGFREGLRSYFKKYAWKNTERKDFIGSIGEASKKDLNDWTKRWLQTAGPNRVSVSYKCEEKKITEAWIEQKESVSKTHSPHRTRIGLYELDDNELELEKTIDVIYTEAKTKVEGMVGKDCPDFVLPNLGDQDYALFSFDKKSLENAKTALTTLSDPLSRMMVWAVLGQMVRDSELKPKDYFEYALAGLEKEKDDLLLGLLLARHSTIRDHYFLYLTEEERAKLAPRFEELLWKRITKAEKGSSLQMAFFDFYVSMAQTKTATDGLHTMLTNNTPPEGITLDQDRRWAILTNLATNGHAEAKALSQKEIKNDNSTMGTRMVYGINAALPNIKAKKAAWEEMISKDLPYSNFKEAASNFHGPNQSKLSAEFVEPFFKKVTTMDWKSNDTVVDIYFEELYPKQICSKTVMNLSAQKLKAAKNLTSIARRSWREAHDELSRCVKVRAGANELAGFSE